MFCAEANFYHLKWLSDGEGTEFLYSDEIGGGAGKTGKASCISGCLWIDEWCSLLS